MNNLFSIVIPVYNSVKLLPKCIDSIIKQKRDNIEIIIIDDASTDGTTSICHNLSRAHSCIKLLTHSTNRGVGTSRNYGNKMATGDYIIFVDSDDELFPNALASLERHIQLKKGPDVVLLHYKKDTFPKSSYQVIRGMVDLNNDAEKFIELISQKRFPLSDQWAFAVRRKFILRNNIAFSNVRIGEGELFMSSVICLMETFSGMPQLFYKKNDRDGSLNHTKGIIATEACLQVLIDLYINKSRLIASEIKINFYENYIQAALGIFSALVLLLNEKDIRRLANILEKYGSSINKLEKRPEDITLYEKKVSQSAYNSIMTFRTRILESKIDIIRDYSKNFESVYLYCRSKYTEATIVCLERLKLKIIAIIDDSEEYTGTFLSGYATITAKNFFEIRSIDDPKLLIIITHQKPKVIKKISSSLTRAGISKKQIKSISY